ncbi:hypothetical protein [uncultured Phenylobacterium sp.]|uniref:hypothetical protein n=1 Tax=uncultured Phenylobacterium sp. TaxID=349273 RepID=UPI0025E83819|nr:hypothetical protein [uncultured Phenylobacterium sp.]
MLDELSIVRGDERLVLQEAIQLIRDGKLLADAMAMAKWMYGEQGPANPSPQ